MKNRREFLRALTACLVVAAVVVTPVMAEGPFGVITNVDLEAKKLTLLTPAGSALEIKTSDSTQFASGTGTKLDLTGVGKALASAKQEGRKGLYAKVTHANSVASKVIVGFAEKKEAKK